MLSTLRGIDLTAIREWKGKGVPKNAPLAPPWTMVYLLPRLRDNPLKVPHTAHETCIVEVDLSPEC